MDVMNTLKVPFRHWPLQNATNWTVKYGGQLMRGTKWLSRTFLQLAARKSTFMKLNSTDSLTALSIASYPGGPDEFVALSRKVYEPPVSTLIQSPETRIFRVSSVVFEPHHEIFFTAGTAYRQQLGSGHEWRSLQEKHSTHSHIIDWSWRQRILAATAPINSAKRIESGIVINGRFPSNFYHVLIGIFPRVFLMETLKVVPERVPLLVSESLRGDPFEAILRLFVGSSRQIVFLSDIPHLVSEAYVVESPVPEIGAVKGGHPVPWHLMGSFNFSLMTEYRKFIIETSEKYLPGSQPQARRKIFLKRSGPTRPFNQEEVEDMLIEQGFSVIEIDQYPFLQQVKIFSEAKTIVSTTGAQWTGAMFSEDAKCIVIQPDFLSGSSLFSKLLYLGRSEIFEFPLEIQETTWSAYNGSKKRGHVDVEALKATLSSIVD